MRDPSSSSSPGACGASGRCSRSDVGMSRTGPDTPKARAVSTSGPLLGWTGLAAVVAPEAAAAGCIKASAATMRTTKRDGDTFTGYSCKSVPGVGGWGSALGRSGVGLAQALPRIALLVDEPHEQVLGDGVDVGLVHALHERGQDVAAIAVAPLAALGLLLVALLRAVEGDRLLEAGVGHFRLSKREPELLDAGLEQLVVVALTGCHLREGLGQLLVLRGAGPRVEDLMAAPLGDRDGVAQTQICGL